MVPSADLALAPPKIVFLDGGFVMVKATVPSKYTLDLRWVPSAQGWKIKSILKTPM